MTSLMKWVIVGEMVILLDTVLRPDEMRAVHRRTRSSVFGMWLAAMAGAALWPLFLPAVLRGMLTRRGPR